MYRNYKNSPAWIYALKDDSGKVFYVGLTCIALGFRLHQHIEEARRLGKNHNKEKSAIIRGANYNITIELLESSKTCKQGSPPRHIEYAWMRKFISEGITLTNKHIK